jgi:hypothetical protein
MTGDKGGDVQTSMSASLHITWYRGKFAFRGDSALNLRQPVKPV